MQHSTRSIHRLAFPRLPRMLTLLLATLMAVVVISTPAVGIGPFAEPGGLAVTAGDDGGESRGSSCVGTTLEVGPLGIGPFAEPGG